MSRTVLYTGFDQPYASLAELTLPRMAQYAAMKGMTFRPFYEAPVGMNIYWTGMARGLELFNQGYDRVIYVDVDQLITNPNAERPPMTSGIHLSRDWGSDAVDPWHFSACGFVAFRDVMPFFQRVLELAQDYDGQPFQEQQPMRDVAKRIINGLSAALSESEKDIFGVSTGCFSIHPRRVFNAVPDAVCPGKVCEPWDKTCFAAHLTMAPMQERIELARNIIDGKLQGTV